MQWYSRIRSKTPILPVGIGELGNRALVVIDCEAIAWTELTPSVGHCWLVVLPDFPPVFKGCGVIMLGNHAWAVRGLRVTAACLLAVGSELGCIWRFWVIPGSCSCSIRAGLTRSAVIVSTLPSCRILNTQPLLDMTCKVHRRERSVVVQLRCGAKIHDT